MVRVVCWFSHGAASAVATKMTIAKFPDCTIACIDTGAEHSDNDRFRDECEGWFGKRIQILKSPLYTDTWDVWEKTRYLVGPTGARCTAELKKKVRFAFQQPDDLNIFGYTADTNDWIRADRFQEQNPGVDVWFPLIEARLSKGDCLALIERAGIELPAMYKLGYSNNNCIGCVKGGMGYWNKIRVDFPDVFQRMAELERRMNNTVLRRNGQPIFLDELEPDRGRYHGEVATDCSLDCQTTEERFDIPVHLGRKEG